MTSKYLLCGLATAALIAGGQAVAQGRSGGSTAAGSHGAIQLAQRGGAQSGTNHDITARMRSGGSRRNRDRAHDAGNANETPAAETPATDANNETTATPGNDAAVETDTATPPAEVETRTDARANSQGPANASPTGVTNSNENSVLHDSTTTTTTTTTATTPPTENQPAGTTGVETRTEARANSQGPANASPTGVTNSNENSVLHDSTTTTTTATTPPTENQPAGTTGVETRTEARANSQGPANASPAGVANSNENSVLHDESAPASNLAGLRTGLIVRESSGTQIGTVSRIVTMPDGRIQNVLVTNADRHTIRLAPGALSISGDVVTATSVGGPDHD
jgi:hypothetical protein